MNNYDYPVGADNDPEAPWNEKSNKPKKVEVTVSITLSKTVEIEERERLQKEKLAEMKEQQTEAVKETNEDGCHGVTYYFDESNLEQAVRSQIDLPSKKYSDWSEDDFVVNLE